MKEYYQSVILIIFLRFFLVNFTGGLGNDMGFVINSNYAICFSSPCISI